MQNIAFQGEAGAYSEAAVGFGAMRCLPAWVAWGCR
jgi:hypothetical protein